MMFESVRELQDRLEELPFPATPKTHLPAATVGATLYGKLMADYARDQTGFVKCVRSLDWEVEHVGNSVDPMFALLFTPKGMMTITKFPEYENDHMVKGWLEMYLRYNDSPWRRFKCAVRNWFK